MKKLSAGLRLFMAMSTLAVLIVTEPHASAARAEIPSVSTIQLIANPERWSGKEIATSGFAVFEFEEMMLYVSEADFANNIPINGVALATARGGIEQFHDLNRRYVHVVGVFDAKSKGHMAMASGAILVERGYALNKR